MCRISYSSGEGEKGQISSRFGLVLAFTAVIFHYVLASEW